MIILGNSNKNYAALFAILGALIVMPIQEIYADSSIQFSKTLDVEKNILQQTLTDVQNYENVFSDYVKSAKIINQSEEKKITDISLDLGILPLSVQVEHDILANDVHQISVISGDLKGSKIVTKLEKTWGFDGEAGKGTIVNMDVSLKISGFLSIIGLVNDDLIRFSLDNSLLRLADYTKNGHEEIQEIKVKKKR